MNCRHRFKASGEFAAVAIGEVQLPDGQIAWRAPWVVSERGNCTRCGEKGVLRQKRSYPEPTDALLAFGCTREEIAAAKQPDGSSKLIEFGARTSTEPQPQPLEGYRMAKHQVLELRPAATSAKNADGWWDIKDGEQLLGQGRTAGEAWWDALQFLRVKKGLAAAAGDAPPVDPAWPFPCTARPLVPTGGA